jgi:hypothetical protein
MHEETQIFVLNGRYKCPIETKIGQSRQHYLTSPILNFIQSLSAVLELLKHYRRIEHFNGRFKTKSLSKTKQTILSLDVHRIIAKDGLNFEKYKY